MQSYGMPASSRMAENSARAQRGLVLTTSLVSSLIMLDSNIVAVSLPTIARSLDATFTDIQWVIGAYVLTYAALLLAAGNYADLRGRRKTMLVGLTVFAVSSAVCGIATTPTLLNGARAVQGIGGALLLTASLAILSHSFVGAERTRAFAFWGASLGVALARRRCDHRSLRLALGIPHQPSGVCGAHCCHAPGRRRISRSVCPTIGRLGHYHLRRRPSRADLGSD